MLPARFGCPGHADRVGRDFAEGIHRRIKLLDALEYGGHGLYRRSRPGAVKRQEFARRQFTEFALHVATN